MKKTTSIVLCILFLSSCNKKELPVPAYGRGDVITTQVEMGGDYKNQVWFSLHDNKIVSMNLKTDWDLAFEAAPGGLHIMLNGSKAMKVYKTDFTSLSEVKDTTGLAAFSKADMPSGNLDSTAIGHWKNNNTVYVVNAGYTPIGLPAGFYKLKILSQDAYGYTFEYANLKSPEVKVGTVQKNNAYNFIAYSFNTNSQLYIEPKKEDFDLCFTQYTHLFYEPEIQYYQVTGVLHNSYKTRVAKLSGKVFNEIELADTTNAPFSNRRNKIGYDWKVFDLNNNNYTVDVKNCYIIHDNKGFYYKLHFVDFVNSSGIKGFPKFEFRKL